MTNFTFIIPHYNINPILLKRCIDSIPERDDVEIIIADDHSPSLYNDQNDLIEAKKQELPYIADSKVKYLFLKENAGPGVARNIAFDKAEGKWIFFTDGDDYYDTDALDKMMNMCLSEDYDVVWFGFNKIDTNHITSIIYGLKECDTKIQRCTEEDKWNFISGLGPWNKVVKADFIRSNNIRFSNAYFNEDQIFSARLVCDSVSTGCFTYPVYNYVQYANSLSKTYNMEKLIRGHKIEKEFNTLLKKHQRLTVETRNSSMGNHLARIFTKSKLLYWYYVAEEYIMFGKDIATADYKQSCIFRNVHPNPFRQLTDPIRVKIGALLK